MIWCEALRKGEYIWRVEVTKASISLDLDRLVARLIANELREDPERG